MDSDRTPYQRDEPLATRLDRNYTELLQELRVAQAGVQILFAFLLALAFQQRFAHISEFQRGVYVVTLICAALAAVLFIAPVAMHRAMFRRYLKGELVFYTARLAIAGLLFLALAMLGALLLIVDVVVGPATAAAVVSCVGLVFVWLWVALPLSWRSRSRPEQIPPGGGSVH